MPPRQPVPQPVTPVQTGSSLLLSGSQPASGTPVGAFSGPWCIEEQSLNMSYWRVPKFYFNSVTAVSLSSLTGTWDNANSTSLRYFVNASYRMSYSTEQFETSAWQQNQKFQVDPVSSDSYGTSYGSLTASSLGPAGNISTAVPYYSRRPWNNATDSTIYESVNGACNFALASSGQSYLWGSINQQEWGGRLFEFGAPRTGLPGTVRHSFEKQEIEVLSPVYTLYGMYSTQQEFGPAISQLIYDVGSRLSDTGSNGGYFATPAELSTQAPEAIHDQSVPSYDPSRHAYDF